MFCLKIGLQIKFMADKIDSYDWLLAVSSMLDVVMTDEYVLLCTMP